MNAVVRQIHRGLFLVLTDPMGFATIPEKIKEDNTMIPYEKLSKKEKRKLDAAKRNTWGSLNPVTRKPASSKAYNRSKARNWKREIHETNSGLFVSTGQIDKIVGIQPTTSDKATHSNLKRPEHFRRSGRGILSFAVSAP